jgi:hypothetical protein
MITSLGFTVAAQMPASAASLTPVNVELSLLIDVSSSVDSREYALQMDGYQQAFTNLASQFGTSEFGSVAVNAIMWSDANRQREVVPWTLINDQASALLFANQIGSAVRPFGVYTAPGSAINFAVPLFSSNQYDGTRWVIDVSGDEMQGEGFSTAQARDNALASGVSAINGLPIIFPRNPSLGGWYSVEDWYRNNIQGGVGSFTIPAYGFEDVGRALEQKLRRELTLSPSVPPAAAVPEPTTILGIALAGGGLACLKRRRSA